MELFPFNVMYICTYIRNTSGFPREKSPRCSGCMHMYTVHINKLHVDLFVTQ